MKKERASSPLPVDGSGPDSAADSGLSALAWAVSSGEAGTVVQQLRAKRQRRQRRWIAAMSVCAVVLAGAAFTWQNRLRSVPLAPGQGVAALAPAGLAPASRTLPDGSVVDLNAGARITVDFSASLRRIVLERGEAHFQVAKDHTRTFVVAVDGVEVRAVGTAFAVRRGDAAVDVLVTEGRVAIDQTGANERPAVAAPSRPAGIAGTAQTIALLDAGHRVTVPLAPAPATGTVPVVQSVSAAETNQRLAWRVPRLEFSGTPLGEAIPLFNRHSPRQLVLDSALASLQVSGTLRADDTDSLLLLLKNEFGIEAEARGTNEIVLRRPGSGSRDAR